MPHDCPRGVELGWGRERETERQGEGKGRQGGAWGLRLGNVSYHLLTVSCERS